MPRLLFYLSLCSVLLSSCTVSRDLPREFSAQSYEFNGPVKTDNQREYIILNPDFYERTKIDSFEWNFDTLGMIRTMKGEDEKEFRYEHSGNKTFMMDSESDQILVEFEVFDGNEKNRVIKNSTNIDGNVYVVYSHFFYKNGYMVGSEYIAPNDATVSINMKRKKVLVTKYSISTEGMEFTSYYDYKKFDSYGNWISRVSTINSYDEISYRLEEREFEYY
ncbi:MAG: hypothetical protein LUF90_01055 [Rikenellaceae bacterium]|nr:hypothetical protein [Rikenellaceae bacterium]